MGECYRWGELRWGACQRPPCVLITEVKLEVQTCAEFMAHTSHLATKHSISSCSHLLPFLHFLPKGCGVLSSIRVIHSPVLSVPGPPTEPQIPPLRLGKLSASNASPNSLDLSWTVEAGDFDSFIVQYRDAHDKPRALPVDGGLRALHVHDLAPSHRYQFNLFGLSGQKRLGPITTEATTGQPCPF